MGRLLTFLARIVEDGKAPEARAIAVDERTAALVETDGKVAIEGEGTAYFLRITGKAEVCKSGVPLSLAKVAVYRVKAGDSFDLKKWTGRGGAAYELSVRDALVSSTQAGGAIY
jgi:cyanophycinase-like exopeptidase